MTTGIRAGSPYDIPFPTSGSGAGSDAMDPDPDCSAAYVWRETDQPAEPAGHRPTFTIAANEIRTAAIEALAPHVGRCSHR